MFAVWVIFLHQCVWCDCKCECSECVTSSWDLPTYTQYTCPSSKEKLNSTAHHTWLYSLTTAASQVSFLFSFLTRRRCRHEWHKLLTSSGGAKMWTQGWVPKLMLLTTDPHPPLGHRISDFEVWGRGGSFVNVSGVIRMWECVSAWLSQKIDPHAQHHIDTKFKLKLNLDTTAHFTQVLHCSLTTAASGGSIFRSLTRRWCRHAWHKLLTSRGWDKIWTQGWVPKEMLLTTDPHPPLSHRITTHKARESPHRVHAWRG